MHPTYFEEDDLVPALIPIRSKKKKNHMISQQPAHLTNEEVMEAFAKQFDKQVPEKQTVRAEKATKPPLSTQKLEELDKKFWNLHEKGTRKDTGREKTDKILASTKQKELQKSKYLINDIMKKIDAKNITEELYPITTETIVKNIRKIENEIEELKLQAERKESSLVSNPNNQHLRKELQNLKSAIDRCVTIKELYNEKINFRNQISVLEKQIITLKEDNENLRIQRHQDKEASELHALGQPCQKQKQLKEELFKCKFELKQVTDIKEKLQNNVNEIIQSFKRLYEEADMARMIVSNKLRQIQNREKLAGPQRDDSEKNTISAIEQEKKSPKPSQNRDNSNYQYNRAQRQSLQQINVNNNRTPMKTDEKSATKHKGFSHEDQIKKMRNNQITAKKF